MDNLENEIWKDIPDYEGIYQASNKGRIRTCVGKTTYTNYHKARHWKQRIIKPKGQTYKTGYRVSLWKNGKQKDWLVARLVAMTFLGESDLTVNHIDGNRFNNNIENLEWCSLADNIRHAFNTGLIKTTKKVKLINKKTNEITFYRSMQLASLSIGRNHGYIFGKVKKNQYEDLDYKWELIK